MPKGKTKVGLTSLVITVFMLAIVHKGNATEIKRSEKMLYHPKNPRTNEPLKPEEMNEIIGNISCIQFSPPGTKASFKKHDFMWKYSFDAHNPERIPYKISIQTFNSETGLGLKTNNDNLPVADIGSFCWIQNVNNETYNFYFSSEEEAKRILKELEEGGFFDELMAPSE